MTQPFDLSKYRSISVAGARIEGGGFTRDKRRECHL